MIRKILIGIGTLVIVILLSAIAIPLIYKDTIKESLKSQLNKELKARVDFADIGLSLFKSFPDLNLAIYQFHITAQPDTLFKDTILFMEETQVVLDLMTVLRSSETVQLKKILIHRPTVSLTIDKDGLSNYDLFKEPSSKEENAKNEDDLDIRLTRFELNDARVRYSDQVNGTSVFLPDLDITASGHYQGEQLLLDTKAQATSFYLGTGGIDYAENMNVSSDLSMNIDLQKATCDILDGFFNINGLGLGLDGKIGTEDMGVRMDLNFSAPQNNFSDLWSIVPSFLKSDMGDITTTGLFTLEGRIAGLLDTETGRLPGMDLKLNTENARVDYATLGQTLSNINTDIKFVHDEATDVDYISINQLDFDAGSSRFRSRAGIIQQEGNLLLDGFLDSKIDLKDIPGMTKSRGIIRSDLRFEGTSSDIKAERYDNLSLAGNVSLDSIILNIEGQPSYSINASRVVTTSRAITAKEVDIQAGRSDFLANIDIRNPLGFLISGVRPVVIISSRSRLIDADEWLSTSTTDESIQTEISSPETTILPMDAVLEADLEIETLKYDSYDLRQISGMALIDRSHLSIPRASLVYAGQPMLLSAELDDVADYVYNGGILTGKLSINADEFDLDQYLGDGTETDVSEQNSAEMYIVPDLMNLDIDTRIKKVKYSGTEFNAFTGNINIHDQQLDLKNVTSDVLGGKMQLIGAFRANGRDRPSFNFKYDVIELPFAGVYKQVETVRLLAPLAKYVEGIFNSTLVVEGLLQDDMMPELSSLTASGYMETLKGKLGKLPFLDKMADALAVSELNGLELENTRNWFEVRNGALVFEPFDHTFNDMVFRIGGSTTYEKVMDFQIRATIPKDKLENIPGGAAVNKGFDWAGKEAQRLGFNVSKIDSYVFDVQIKGAITDPDIKVKLADVKMSTIGDNIKTVLRDTLNSEKERLITEARSEASKTIDKIKDTTTTRIKEELDKNLEDLKDAAKTKTGELIDSTVGTRISDEIEKKAGKILDSTSREKVEDIKGKIEKFNPFKKKGK